MKIIVYKAGDESVKRCAPNLWFRLVGAFTSGKQRIEHKAPVPFYDVVRVAGEEVEPEWAETEDAFVDRVRAKDVPAGAVFVVVDETELPPARLQEAWQIVGGTLGVDAGKAEAMARTCVDARADLVRLRYVPHPSVIPEYQETETEARAFKERGYPADVPLTVKAWADAKKWSAQAACDDILAAAAMLRGKLQQIRAVRLAGKEAIAAGVKSVEQVEAELDAL
jgi:hypothetical protein